MRRACPLLCLLVLTTCVFAKESRTFYTDEMVAQAVEKADTLEWAKSERASAVSACQWLIDMSDDELWDFVPPPEQTRALNVSFGVGCPVHGAEVFRKGGHYPWIMTRDLPFKVKCPVGGEVYPSNDFEPWNLEGTSGEPETGPGFVDKGIGWKDEAGKRYFFVGCYIFWQRWQREIFPAMRDLPKAYLLTGDPIYAHKCAVLLARLAQDYPRQNYPTQAYHNGKWPAAINGRIMDYIWETGIISNFARAYDAVYPAFSQDPELVAFLKARGVDDGARHVETNMLHTMANDIMRGFISGNYGMYQQALATVAIVLDNDDSEAGPTTKQMTDWILTGPGDVEYAMWNGFYRDGFGGEASPGYSTGWCVNFYETAALLDRLGVDLWSNPKVKKMADIWLDLAVAGAFTPDIGDSGSILGSRRAGWSNALQGVAFRHYGGDRYARALTFLNAKTESLWDESVDDQVAAIVAEKGADMDQATRNLGGMGLAILESGREPHKRGVAMYYGHAGGGHGHRDRLNIEMFAFDRPMLTDMGYPAHWLEKNAYWTSNTTSHYAVLVDQSGHGSSFPGYLNTLAASPSVQLMDASAERVAYPGKTSMYRRTTAMIDTSEQDSYLLDIYRVQGGRNHDWSFHGPPFPEFTVSGGQPGPIQDKGTLAGEDVPFGTRPKSRVSADGMTVDLPGAQGVITDDRPYAERSQEGWATYSSGSVLTQKQGAEMRDQCPPIAPGKVRVFLHAYDYDSGTNEVEITLGQVSRTLRWEPSGKVGYRWISEAYDLAEPVSEITVTAREAGQNYILIDGLVVGPDVGGETPRIADLSYSGFQYMFNVRRMKPEGNWSATWRKPDEDLALTMTMLEGCVDEAILADAEPELKPNHPDTLQYVLGRNELARAEDPEGGLASMYVALVEPHQGTAKINGTSRLTATGAGQWATGVQVTREGETDLIHSALGGESLDWQGAAMPFAAAGEFALATVDDKGLKRACLVNGTALKCGAFELQAEPSPAGRVLSVDYERNAITVDTGLAAPDAFLERVMILGNELHQTSYTIKSVATEGNKTTLAFGDVLFLVGMGKITEIDEDADAIVTDTQLTGYGRVDGGQHQGRWLYNEDKSRGIRIVSFKGDRFALEGVEGALADIFTDADGDGRRRFWVSDIGPGDDFRVPTVTYVKRTAPNTYDVEMMTGVKITVQAP